MALMQTRDEKIRTLAYVAGAVVAGGLVVAYVSRKRKCKTLAGIHSKNDPLHLTSDAYEEAHNYAEDLIARYVISGEEIGGRSEVYLKVAEHVQSCANWQDPPTEEIEQSFQGIKAIVDRVYAEADSDPAKFVQKVRGR